MSLHAIQATRLRPDRARAGLTLTEVLFAAGILALGVLGIMSLVPSAMHQVAATSANTRGAAIAKNALVALQNGQVDMRDYNLWPVADTALYSFNASYRLGETMLAIEADSTLVEYGDWPAAIYAWHVYQKDLGYPGVGDGTGAPTFRLPADTDLFSESTWQGLVGQDNAPPMVPVGWARSHGWTATFLPISADDDGDGRVDEDGYDGVDTDYDDLVDEDGLIMPTTVYRIQIAVWRYPAWQSSPERVFTYGDGAVSGTFTDGDTEVVLDAPVPLADVGDYVRMDAHGVWYKILALEDKEEPSPVLTLSTTFLHPSLFVGATMRGDVSIASNFKLIGLYEGIVEPVALGAAP
jgi:Tfp pilus assembly protein PilV